ncbi:ATP-grasp domain-containing protein [Streptomyces sp. NPDC001770]
MRTDIVVQNVASFRIDPAVLVRPHRRTWLIASPAQHQKLVKRHREDAFSRIAVLEEFTADALTACVESLRETLPAADRDDVALLCHDEYSLGAVAEVRRRLGLAGDLPGQLAPFIDKIAMKRALEGAGVRLPRHQEWDAGAYAADAGRYVAGLEDALGWPMFVKPLDESGSVGARQLADAGELRDWAATAGDRRYEVDEFLRGTLYHVDTAVSGGAVVHVEANAYLHPCYDYVHGKVCASHTLPEDHPVRASLLAFNHRVLEALPDKPSHGVYHHEIYRRPDGELVFLEIAARAPAALVPSTSRIRRGLDIEEAHFRLQRGEELPGSEGVGPHAAWVYFPKVEGRIRELHRATLLSDHHWQWNVETGQTTEAPEDIRDFAASVLLWNEDFDVLLQDLSALDSHTAVVTD